MEVWVGVTMGVGIGLGVGVGLRPRVGFGNVGGSRCGVELRGGCGCGVGLWILASVRGASGSRLQMKRWFQQRTENQAAANDLSTFRFKHSSNFAPKHNYRT